MIADQHRIQHLVSPPAFPRLSYQVAQPTFCCRSAQILVLANAAPIVWIGQLILAMCAVYRYIYHSLYAFFDRDNVGLPGFAEYFR